MVDDEDNKDVEEEEEEEEEEEVEETGDDSPLSAEGIEEVFLDISTV